MITKKEHLNIDLEFLDKEEDKVVPKRSVRPTNQSSSSYNSTSIISRFKWKKIFIIGGIILFIVFLMSSDDNSSSSSTSNTYNPPISGQGLNNNSDDYILGEYRCSHYNYNQAMALSPSETEQQIDSATSLMEYKTKELERLSSDMDNMYINDYSSQWEIDQFNTLVDDYNSKLPAYKRDLDSYNIRLDRYNNQVDKYNNYLENNCTKI